MRQLLNVLPGQGQYRVGDHRLDIVLGRREGVDVVELKVEPADVERLRFMFDGIRHLVDHDEREVVKDRRDVGKQELLFRIEPHGRLAFKLRDPRHDRYLLQGFDQRLVELQILHAEQLRTDGAEFVLHFHPLPPSPGSAAISGEGWPKWYPCAYSTSIARSFSAVAALSTNSATTFRPS